MDLLRSYRAEVKLLPVLGVPVDPGDPFTSCPSLSSQRETGTDSWIGSWGRNSLIKAAPIIACGQPDPHLRLHHFPSWRLQV